MTKGFGKAKGRVATREGRRSVCIQLGAATLNLGMTDDWYSTQDSVQQALTGLQGFLSQGRQEISKSLHSQEDIAVTARVASAITVGSVYLADQIEAGGHALTQNISKKGVVWRERSRLKKEVKIAPAILGGVTQAALWSGKIEDVAEGFKGHVQGVKKAVAANIGRVAQEVWDCAHILIFRLC